MASSRPSDLFSVDPSGGQRPRPRVCPDRPLLLDPDSPQIRQTCLSTEAAATSSAATTTAASATLEADEQWEAREQLLPYPP